MWVTKTLAREIAVHSALDFITFASWHKILELDLEMSILKLGLVSLSVKALQTTTLIWTVDMLTMDWHYWKKKTKFFEYSSMPHSPSTWCHAAWPGNLFRPWMQSFKYFSEVYCHSSKESFLQIHTQGCLHIGSQCTCSASMHVLLPFLAWPFFLVSNMNKVIFFSYHDVKSPVGLIVLQPCRIKLIKESTSTK